MNHGTTTAKSVRRTGVEIETLVVISMPAPTIYEMAKMMDQEITVIDICLESNTG